MSKLGTSVSIRDGNGISTRKLIAGLQTWSPALLAALVVRQGV